ncbi:TPA: hypothetical protein ACNV64_003536 [Aeromonas salmonicida subsp. pectinolytica]
MFPVFPMAMLAEVARILSLTCPGCYTPAPQFSRVPGLSSPWREAACHAALSGKRVFPPEFSRQFGGLFIRCHEFNNKNNDSHRDSHQDWYGKSSS